MCKANSLSPKCVTRGKHSQRLGVQCGKALEAVGHWLIVTLTDERRRQKGWRKQTVMIKAGSMVMR